MKHILPCVLALCLLLSGCSSILDSDYQNISPHEIGDSYAESGVVSVNDYSGLYTALAEMVKNGTESGILSVAQYNQKRVESDMKKAVGQVMITEPIAAYAVEKISYEVGSNAGVPAVAVSIAYLHDRMQLRRIRYLPDLKAAESTMAKVLDDCDSGIVMYIESYEEMDFSQWVADYAAENPDRVMEKPEVTANIYPETGSSRVVELKFRYQNSRESLREMQSSVRTLFDAASVYAGEDGDEAERYFKLYSFLMGLFQNFQLETSITPAYSLLQHGVGDSKAFATVYAAMCEKAGLESIVVTGTRSGVPWHWNIVCCEGVNYHVDLWQCDREDNFIMKTDGDMSGYVWDYSAYPACGASPIFVE